MKPRRSNRSRKDLAPVDNDDMIYGDVPTLNLLHPAAVNYDESLKIWHSGLPPGEETFINIGGQDVPTADVEINIRHGAQDFAVKILREIDEHKPEVIFTTITVGGLIAATMGIRSRRKRNAQHPDPAKR